MVARQSFFVFGRSFACFQGQKHVSFRGIYLEPDGHPLNKRFQNLAIHHPKKRYIYFTGHLKKRKKVTTSKSNACKASEVQIPVQFRAKHGYNNVDCFADSQRGGLGWFTCNTWRSEIWDPQRTGMWSSSRIFHPLNSSWLERFYSLH